MESTYNTDSLSKISAVGKYFEKIYLRIIYAITHKGVSPLEFLYISASSYIYTNYIFLESTYNTDSHSKISVIGRLKKNIYIRKNYAITRKGYLL